MCWLNAIGRETKYVVDGQPVLFAYEPEPYIPDIVRLDDGTIREKIICPRCRRTILIALGADKHCSYDKKGEPTCSDKCMPQNTAYNSANFI